MQQLRKPLQGLGNIIRFNWHFYLIALLCIGLLLWGNFLVDDHLKFYFLILLSVVCLSTGMSLLASFYIYDFSDFYSLKWLKKSYENKSIVNINAGFDETTVYLKQVFPQSTIQILDFYDAKKHTEISIKRARKAYPLAKSCQTISTLHIPIRFQSIDLIFLVLAAHEIRDSNERTLFFKEIHRILKPNGEVYMVEHLRNIPNFLAFNIGFLHFYSKKNWMNNFKGAGFDIVEEKKHTPFISIFKLMKNDCTP